MGLSSPWDVPCWKSSDYLKSQHKIISSTFSGFYYTKSWNLTSAPCFVVRFVSNLGLSRGGNFYVCFFNNNLKSFERELKAWPQTTHSWRADDSNGTRNGRTSREKKTNRKQQWINGHCTIYHILQQLWTIIQIRGSRPFI